MSRQTTNYGLTKPDYTDTADIEVVNANMDIIDGALKVIDTKSNNVMSKNSSAWSSTVAYAVGQYCIYNNSLWKSLVQHSGQTPQEGTYWARVSLDTLDSEINALNSNLSNKIKTINSNDFTINIPDSGVIALDLTSVIDNFEIADYTNIISVDLISFSGNNDNNIHILLPYENFKCFVTGNPNTTTNNVTLRVAYFT